MATGAPTAAQQQGRARRGAVSRRESGPPISLGAGPGTGALDAADVNGDGEADLLRMDQSGLLAGAAPQGWRGLRSRAALGMRRRAQRRLRRHGRRSPRQSAAPFSRGNLGTAAPRGPDGSGRSHGTEACHQVIQVRGIAISGGGHEPVLSLSSSRSRGISGVRGCAAPRVAPHQASIMRRVTSPTMSPLLNSTPNMLISATRGMPRASRPVLVDTWYDSPSGDVCRELCAAADSFSMSSSAVPEPSASA